MEKAKKCPNMAQCFLIKSSNTSISQIEKENYIRNFYFSLHNHFLHCKRYQTSVELHFCPDFVLPDTALSIDKIIEKYDEEIN